MSAPTSPTENVVRGAMLALLVIPVGAVVLTLVSSIGFVASIIGFLVAFGALWLYQRGSGGAISRAGAWAVTLIVLATLFIGVWFSLMVAFAGGLGRLDDLVSDGFLDRFSIALPELISENVLFILLIFAFGVLGSFRLLARAFATARRVAPSPNASMTFPSSAPTTYVNDVGAAPTGSADDKTVPPTTIK